MKMMRQKYAVATIAFLLLVGIAPAIIAGAQSPTPASKMTNVVSSDSYPTGYGVGINSDLSVLVVMIPIQLATSKPQLLIGSTRPTRQSWRSRLRRRAARV
jgi:hypothetical protein